MRHVHEHNQEPMFSCQPFEKITDRHQRNARIKSRYTTTFHNFAIQSSGMYATRTVRRIKIRVTKRRNCQHHHGDIIHKLTTLNLMLAHEHSSHPHPGADAHAVDEHPAAGLLGDIQGSGDLARASASQRVADGNSTAIDVDLLEGDLEVLYAEDGLRRERLVDLVEVDVVEGDAREVECARDGVGWADTHDPRWDADGGSGDEFSEDG
jgi:hypothetical protein